jgi:hypothetical protein
MSAVVRRLCVAVCATVLSAWWSHSAERQPRETPSLSEIVFMGLRPAKELNQARYRKEGLPCLRKYLTATAQAPHLRAFEPPSSPEKAVRARRRNLSEQMVAILGQSVRNEAEAFANAIPLTAEWEGMSAGPVEEAHFVDTWLDNRPGTPLAPFLHLFKAHRLRAAYEAARAAGEKGLCPILTKRHREALDKARSSGNPLISCIADDLEAQPFVYLEGQGSP